MRTYWSLFSQKLKINTEYRVSFHEITEFVVDDKTGADTVVVEDTTELLVVDGAPGAAEVDDKSGDPDVEEFGPGAVVDDGIGAPELEVDDAADVVEGSACVLEDIAIVVLVVVVTARVVNLKNFC